MTKQMGRRQALRRFLLSDGAASLVAAVVTILLGLLVGLVVLLIVEPTVAPEAFKMLVTGAFGTIGVLPGMGRALYYGITYILVGLAVGFVFKTGVFNIGVVGQYLMGVFAAICVGILWEPAFGSWTWLPAILAGALFGAVWGALQGTLMALKNVNAIVCGIMMNYIGLFLVHMILESDARLFVRGRSWTEDIPMNSLMPRGGLDNLFGATTSANVGIFIAVAVCIAAWLVLKKTTFGYELKAVGFNPDASKYAGINVKKIMIIGMLMAGLFAGLGGAMTQLGNLGNRYIVVDTLPAQGFTGISVALIANSNPVAIIFSGLLIAFFSVGGQAMQSLGLEPEFVTIITSVIIYFCSFSFVFKRLYLKLAGRAGRE